MVFNKHGLKSPFCVVGQKKLGKVITPDPWKAGARNTTGIYIYC